MALHSGGVSFDAKGQSYTLRYSVDAICALEDACGGKGIVAISQVLQDATKISMTLMRKVMWAGLRDHHPSVDIKSAGDLIQAVGGLMPAVDIIGRAFQAAFPDPQKAGDQESPQVPAQTQDGIGSASTELGSRAA